MAIKCNVTKDDINHYLKEQMERQAKAIVYQFCIIGEEVVNHARMLPSPSADDFDGKITPHQPNYMDWTANLRSSIGYIVAVDGEIIQMSEFEPIKGGAEGSAKGKQYALQLVEQYPQGAVLIVVAGMHYASYVTGKGYDVLDSAELIARQLVEQIQTKIDNE